MRREDRNVMHAVSRVSCRVPKLISAGLYHKLHGVPRPVAMKKTVIKRRKRVPAVGASNGRSGSAQPVASDQESPAMEPVAMPSTPQNATISQRAIISASPSQPQLREVDRPVPKPVVEHSPAEMRGSSADSMARIQPVSVVADHMGLGQSQKATAAPSPSPAPAKEPISYDRKRPWWIDSRTREREREERERETREREVREREAREREGVSRFSCAFIPPHPSYSLDHPYTYSRVPIGTHGDIFRALPVRVVPFPPGLLLCLPFFSSSLDVSHPLSWHILVTRR